MMETIETLAGKIHCGSTRIKEFDDGVPTGGWWHATHILEGAVTEEVCPRCGAPIRPTAAPELSKESK